MKDIPQARKNYIYDKTIYIIQMIKLYAYIIYTYDKISLLRIYKEYFQPNDEAVYF